MAADAAKISSLNDAFRRARRGGRVLKTSGINALPQDDQLAIYQKIRLFDQFNEADDPYGEHDFGALEHAGERVLWKIDYYSPDMKHGSEDPGDPTQTVRVMTIMLASEY